MTRVTTHARFRRSLLVTAAGLGLFVAPPPCRGDAPPTKTQCAQSNTAAQDLRRDGRLAASRQELQNCAQPACPALVRDDCSRRLDELDKAQPTIAFEVKDASGADVSSVAVTLDGKPWAESLEGKALPADPGKHVFVFTVAGHTAITRTLVLTEGEKGRRERIELDGSAATGAAPARTPSSAGSALLAPGAGTSSAPSGGASARLGTQKILGLTVGGLGVAGIGLGAVFGLMTFSSWSSAKTACGGDPSQCKDVTTGQSHRSTAETEATISTVGFVAGGVLLATGAALFFAAKSPESRSTTGLVVSPSAGPGQAGLRISGEF
jgi:hypothetical protein